MPLDEGLHKTLRKLRYWPIVSAKLRIFTTEMETSLQQSMNNLQKKHAVAIDALKTGKQVSMGAIDVEEIFRIDGLPRLMRNAVFLVVFGVYEHHVAAICTRIHDNGSNDDGAPKGTHLQDSYKYLTNIVKLPESAFGTAWRFLDAAREVRNFIAHEAAAIPDTDTSDRAKRVRKFIDEADHIKLEGEYIQLDGPFVPSLIDRMDEAFRDFVAVG